jgi:hypothetical protein
MKPFRKEKAMIMDVLLLVIAMVPLLRSRFA